MPLRFTHGARAGLCACLGLLASCSGSTAPDPGVGLESLLIHFEVNATPQAPFVDLAAGKVFFLFEGDMVASVVGPATGRVTGKDPLSGGRGTIRMNGQFDFSSPFPAALADALAGFAGGGHAWQPGLSTPCLFTGFWLRGEAGLGHHCPQA